MERLRYVKVDLTNIDIAFNIQKNEWPKDQDYENYTEMIKFGDAKNINFIVYLKNTPIGITGVYTERLDPKTMWLNWYCVLPKYRGKGYGEQILLDTISYCKQFDDIDYFRLDTSFNAKRPSSNLYLKVMDFIEKYIAEDDDNYISGNYICSKRLKDNIDYIPWNNKNLHLREYYSKTKSQINDETK